MFKFVLGLKGIVFLIVVLIDLAKKKLKVQTIGNLKLLSEKKTQCILCILCWLSCIPAHEKIYNTHIFFYYAAVSVTLIKTNFTLVQSDPFNKLVNTKLLCSSFNQSSTLNYS